MRRIGKTILGIIFSLLIMFVSGSLVLSILNGPKNVQKCSNGDKVYIPTEDTLQYDAKNYVTYYDNLLIAYLEKELSKKEKNQLAKNVDGKLVGDITGCMNVIQIKVDHTDYTNLTEKAKKLMESEEVIYASYEFPMEIEDNEASENDKNPWENGEHNENNHDANENKPSGNDWWAEAIRAYTAWNYVDSDQVNLSEVSVGILDSGIDTEHEEFQKDGKTKINFLKDYTANTPRDHGDHVTGLIGAEDNSVGLRGIADKANLYFVDRRQNSRKIQNETVTSSGEYVEITKQLIEKGCVVINNSWAVVMVSDRVFSETAENDEELKDFESYEEYQRSVENIGRESSYQLIEMINQLLLNHTEKFLIVQAAGNGYDNGGLGYDASLSGHYCSVIEKNYDTLNENRKFSKNGYKYEDFKEHIMIVGAVEINEGSYKLTNFSNYGNVVDIVAPGENIYSTVTTKDDKLEGRAKEIDGLQYVSMPGTSVAAPMVSGSAALVWSVNPNLSAKEVKDILIDTAGTAYSSNKNDSREEYPMLDVGLAVQIAGKKLTEQTENTDTSDNADTKNTDSKKDGDKQNKKSEDEKPYFVLDNEGYKLIKNIRRNTKINIDNTQLDYVNSNFVKFSKDDKYIFYLEADESNTGKTLCRCEYEKLKEDSEENGNFCKIVAKNVQANYVPLKDGKVAYLDDANRLYYYDGNKSILLEESEVNNLYATDDTERIVYECAGIKILYGIDLKNPNEKKAIASDYDYLYPITDLNYIYYCNDTDVEEEDYSQERDIYVTGFNKEAKKLGYEVYNSDFYDDTVYYTVDEEKTFNYEEHVTDSSGNKSRLNSIKNYLKSSEPPIKLQTLCSYKKGKVSVIAKNTMWSAAYSNSINYTKPATTSKIDIANISSEEEIRSKVWQLLNENEFLVSILDGSSVKLTGDAAQTMRDHTSKFSNICVTKSEVFIDNMHYDDEDLIVAKINDGKASSFETITNEGYIQGIQGSTVYYIEGTKEKNDLYSYKDGEKKCIATEFVDNSSSYLDIYEDSTMLSYINFNGESGTLLLLDSEGQQKVIGDNVTMYIRSDKDTILYIDDGRLMSYKYGKTKKIMNNARWIWSFNSLKKIGNNRYY